MTNILSKYTKKFAIIASILMIVVIAIPMVAAETDYDYCDETYGYSEIELNYNIFINSLAISTPPCRSGRMSLHLIEICPTIERVTLRPHLLIASTCNNRQKIIFEAIEKYSEVSEKEQKSLKEFMEDIWEKYPITKKIVDENYLIKEGIWNNLFEYDDEKNEHTITLYQFDMDEINTQNIKLADKENEILEVVWKSLINRVISNTNNNTYDAGFNTHDAEIGILWSGGGRGRSNDYVHQDMTRMAVDWRISGDCSHWFVRRAANAADNPDCLIWIGQNQIGNQPETRFRDDFSARGEEFIFNFLRNRWHRCDADFIRKWTHIYIYKYANPIYKYLDGWCTRRIAPFWCMGETLCK